MRNTAKIKGRRQKMLPRPHNRHSNCAVHNLLLPLIIQSIREKLVTPSFDNTVRREELVTLA